MSKTISSALRTHLQGEALTLATLWRITRTDGVELFLTDHDRDITYDGNTYLASSGGYSRSGISTKSDFSVDNLDLEGVLRGTILSNDAIDDADLRAGRFDFAEVRISIVNWEDLSMGDLKLRRGWLGEVKIRDDVYEAELRGMTQVLTRSISEVYAPDCRADLFDARCGLQLADFLESSTVDTVASRRQFTLPANFHLVNSLPATTAERDRVLLSADGVFTMLPAGPSDGTPLRPYEVSTPAELDDVRNDPLAHYVLTQDIDMGAFGAWTPIPDFAGVLDGRGYRILNLDLDHSGGSEEAGLFQNLLTGAVVRRVGIVDATLAVANTTRYCGPVVANNASGAGDRGGVVEDCYAEGCAVETFLASQRAGGLIGEGSGITVRRCWANTTGINPVSLTTASFTVNEGSGNQSVTLTTGRRLLEDIRAELETDLNAHAMLSHAYTVSIVGSRQLRIETPAGQDFQVIGGGAASVLGWGATTVSFNVQTGTVIADSAGTGNFGGIVAQTGSTILGSVEDSYFDARLSETEAVGGGTGSNETDPLDTTERYQRASYDGFDFTSDWKISEGVGYPQFIDPGRGL